MPDLQLKPRAAFAGMMRAGRHGAMRGTPGVTARELTGRSLWHVEARRGRGDAAAASLATMLALAGLPPPRSLVSAGPVTLAWSGPGLWTIARDDGQAFPTVNEASFRKVASVVDQSDGRISLRLGGPALRDALAKGIAVDLDPHVFRVGSVALTQLSHLPVQLWHVTEGNVFDLIVPRAAAGDIWHWLESAAAEFGLEVIA